MQKRFGEHLRQLREAAGLTQDQVAEAVGWSRPWVTKLEGLQSPPERINLPDWKKYAGELKCDLTVILFGGGPKADASTREVHVEDQKTGLLLKLSDAELSKQEVALIESVVNKALARQREDRESRPLAADGT